MDKQDPVVLECVSETDLGILMPHTFTIESEEKQILEKSKSDEVVDSLKASGPRLLSIVDSRTFLLSFATVSLVSKKLWLHLLRACRLAIWCRCTKLGTRSILRSFTSFTPTLQLWEFKVS